jgi:hypothetical protein
VEEGLERGTSPTWIKNTIVLLGGDHPPPPPPPPGSSVSLPTYRVKLGDFVHIQYVGRKLHGQRG